MLFYYSESTDPYYNLALEEHIFSNVKMVEPFFMLWQNDNTIVIGRNQNAVREINTDFVRKMNTRVARRSTGGGAVYHDLGNLNYSFIQNCENGQKIDFTQFALPIIRALDHFGVKAVCNNRNDLIIEGRKFSGTAQTVKNGRVLHHGTLLFNSDLDFLRQALTVKGDKIESKGVKSVSSHITNIIEHLPNPIAIEQFRNCLMTSIIKKNNPFPFRLTEEDFEAIKQLRQTKYVTWDWNYGKSPRYEMQKTRDFQFGHLTISMSVLQQGIIDSISITGKFSGNQDIHQLENFLKGKVLKESELLEVLSYCKLNDFIAGITVAELAEILVN
ncbi:MAG: lipoate--protein ligase [Acetobacterium woodii]|nr:lipoate--protein ligase [Acetobacterium woodii]